MAIQTRDYSNDKKLADEMKENMAFLACGDLERTVFVHTYTSQDANAQVVIFLNPLWDEKRRAQAFIASTSRELCSQGINVVTFDYYGTGDSPGELTAFNLLHTKTELDAVIHYAEIYFSPTRISVIGIRFGADLAGAFLLNDPRISDITLIEPIVEGARYLKELKIRRLSLLFLLKMKVNTEIEIDGKKYVDHQGYPLSTENISYLERWQFPPVHDAGNRIRLYKLNCSSSEAAIEKMCRLNEGVTHLTYERVDCPEFWLFGVAPETTRLKDSIVKYLREGYN